MSEERKAVVLLALTAVLWSTSGVLIKAIRWNPMAIAGTRSAVTAAVLLAFVRRRNFTWSAAQLGGAVAYAGTVVLFVVATKLTTAHNAILLQYTAPIHIALFGPWFLNERAHWFDWLVIALLLGGMVLFFLDKLSATGTWGNLLAIASGVSFGWMTLFLRKQKAASPLESIFLGNLLAAAVCCPFIFGSMPRLGRAGVGGAGLPGRVSARGAGGSVFHCHQAGNGAGGDADPRGGSDPQSRLGGVLPSRAPGPLGAGRRRDRSRRGGRARHPHRARQ